MLLWLVAAVLMANALVGDRGLLALRRARHDRAKLASTVVDLRQENSRLREKAQRLSNDPAEIESLARHELGLVQPGEVLFIIRDVGRLKRHSSLGADR